MGRRGESNVVAKIAAGGGDLVDEWVDLRRPSHPERFGENPGALDVGVDHRHEPDRGHLRVDADVVFAHVAGAGDCDGCDLAHAGWFRSVVL